MFDTISFVVPHHVHHIQMYIHIYTELHIHVYVYIYVYIYAYAQGNVSTGVHNYDPALSKEG